MEQDSNQLQSSLFIIFNGIITFVCHQLYLCRRVFLNNERKKLILFPLKLSFGDEDFVVSDGYVKILALIMIFGSYFVPQYPHHQGV